MHLLRRGILWNSHHHVIHWVLILTPLCIFWLMLISQIHINTYYLHYIANHSHVLAKWDTSIIASMCESYFDICIKSNMNIEVCCHFKPHQPYFFDANSTVSWPEGYCNRHLIAASSMSEIIHCSLDNSESAYFIAFIFRHLVTRDTFMVVETESSNSMRVILLIIHSMHVVIKGLRLVMWSLLRSVLSISRG